MSRFESFTGWFMLTVVDAVTGGSLGLDDDLTVADLVRHAKHGGAEDHVVYRRTRVLVRMLVCLLFIASFTVFLLTPGKCDMTVAIMALVFDAWCVYAYVRLWIRAHTLSGLIGTARVLDVHGS